MPEFEFDRGFLKTHPAVIDNNLKKEESKFAVGDSVRVIDIKRKKYTITNISLMYDNFVYKLSNFPVRVKESNLTLVKKKEVKND